MYIYIYIHTHVCVCVFIIYWESQAKCWVNKVRRQHLAGEVFGPETGKALHH